MSHRCTEKRCDIDLCNFCQLSQLIACFVNKYCANMVVTCCVVNCRNTDQNCNCSFYRFATVSWKLDQRNKWIAAVNRKNIDGSPWFPKPHNRICSAHFIGGKKSEEQASPSYVPTLFPPAHGFKKAQRNKKEKCALPMLLNVEETSDMISDQRVLDYLNGTTDSTAASSASSDELIVLKPQTRASQKLELKINTETLISDDQNTEPEFQNTEPEFQNTEPDIIMDRIKTEEMVDPLIIDQTQIMTTETNHVDYKEGSLSQEPDTYAPLTIELVPHLPKIVSQDAKNCRVNKEDSFDHFGRFIASLLRETSPERAAKLQRYIVSLILMPETNS